MMMRIQLYTILPRSEMEKNTYIEKAEERGFHKGMDQKNLEVAKKMLQEQIDINIISKITGLTEVELKRIEY